MLQCHETSGLQVLAGVQQPPFSSLAAGGRRLTLLVPPPISYRRYSGTNRYTAAIVAYVFGVVRGRGVVLRCWGWHTCQHKLSGCNGVWRSSSAITRAASEPCPLISRPTAGLVHGGGQPQLWRPVQAAAGPGGHVPHSAGGRLLVHCQSLPNTPECLLKHSHAAVF